MDSFTEPFKCCCYNYLIMKFSNKLYHFLPVSLAILALFSCEIIHDCPECFTPPGAIVLRILDESDSVDLISNGTYNGDSIRLYYLENNIKHEIDLDVYSDTSFQKSRIVSQEISWKSLEGFKNCYLYLDSNDTDTIFIDVISVFENCCTSHYISDFTINGYQLPYDAVDYNYLLYKKNPGFNRDF